MKTEKYVDSDGQELTKTSWSDGGILYENKQGKPHRLDGPAVIDSDGYKAWYHNGKRHRLDGPAEICLNATVEYWLNGRQVPKRDIDILWLKKQVGK